jgi:hypothetical protein
MSDFPIKSEGWLSAPLGQAGSGRVRYGAAMALYRAGRIGDEALEVYRICANLDGENPVGLLVERGLPVPGETAIAGLIFEADRYIAGLQGVGVADVRAGIVQAVGGAITPHAPVDHPVVARHLPVALATLGQTHGALGAAIETASAHLNWKTFDQYPPDQIGPYFAAGNAFASIIGEDAPLKARDFDLGLFLIAPNVLYRDHHHAAPELYAPLTGPHGWRFGPGTPLQIKPAHEPVWNNPHRPHATKVGHLPFLCLFGWTCDVNAPAQVIPASDWAELEAMRL